MGNAKIQEKIHALCWNNIEIRTANSTGLACCCLKCLFSKGWSVEVVGYFLESRRLSALVYWFPCYYSCYIFTCLTPPWSVTSKLVAPLPSCMVLCMKFSSSSAPFLWWALTNNTEVNSLPLNKNLLWGKITHICYLFNIYTEGPF